MCRLLLSLVTVALFGASASAASLGDRKGGENDVTLHGTIADQIARNEAPLDEVMAAVCGMKHRTSTLSVRTAPTTAGREVFEAPYYSIVELTGKISANRKWAEISSVSRRVDVNGWFVEIAQQKTQAVTGWVSMRYLCEFEM